MTALDESTLPAGVRKTLEKMVSTGEVRFVLLFGSRARDASGPLSDIDIAVMLERGKVADPFEWKTRWTAEIAGPGNDVDIVILDEAPPALRFNVARDSVPLWIGDEHAHHMFRFEAVRDWLDFEPMTRVHQKALVDRIRNGTFGSGEPRNG